MKTFVVCDYPNPKNYTFPSFGFGSSEKRIWQIAKTLSEFNDIQVILTGPLWLPEYVPKAKHFKKRLEARTVDEFCDVFGKADYLFAGHEYFDKREYTDAFFRVASTLASYVLHPYEFGPNTVFDGKKAFLFCYSSEMCRKYAKQKPIQLLLYHSGVGEEPYVTPNPQSYLVWMGRLDAQKAPHYAVEAAEMLGREIKILGKSVYDTEYIRQYRSIFEKSHVTRCGVVFGNEKMKLLSEASCAFYTCDRDYCEAGAGTLGEILCSGVPIAGMSWKGDDAVCAAVLRKELGRIVLINEKMDEGRIARLLANAAAECLVLDRKEIFQIARAQYDMKRLMREMIGMMDRGGR